MGSVPNCQKEIPMCHAIRWFKCKPKSPKNWISEDTQFWQKLKWEVSQIAEKIFSCAMLLAALSVNLTT